MKLRGYEVTKVGNDKNRNEEIMKLRSKALNLTPYLPFYYFPVDQFTDKRYEPNNDSFKW